MARTHFSLRSRSVQLIPKRLPERLCGGARTTVSFGAELCKYLRNDTRNAIGDAKRGVLAELRPGIVQGKGAETAAARTVKKKKCTGSPFRPDFESAPTPKKKLRNSSSRYLRIYTVVMMFSQRTGNQALRKSNLLIKHKKCATNTLSQDVFGSF